MLYNNTLFEIQNNANPGVEYEIALFYRLLVTNHKQEADQVMAAIRRRSDKKKVLDIIKVSDERAILRELYSRNISLVDVSLETQNDEIGPADIVLYTEDKNKSEQEIGLSVKYANTCTLNVTGRNFITDDQIVELRDLLPAYTDMYINEMSKLYGSIEKWFRKRKPSKTTDAYIDKIRDAVIQNWPNVKEKSTLLSLLFHSDSPIEFWIITYSSSGYSIKTKPETIPMSRANDVTVGKMNTSYVAFFLDGKRVGHMQVKFNNGFLEKCKKRIPDKEYQGVKMAYGQPFSSWNFNVEK